MINNDEIKHQITQILEINESYIEKYKMIIVILQKCKEKGLDQDNAKAILLDLIGEDNEFLTEEDDLLLSAYHIVCRFCSPKDHIW